MNSLDRLNISGAFTPVQGYFYKAVRGLRAYETPSECIVKDLQGNILRTEQPVEWGRHFNSRRISNTDFGEKDL